MNFEELRDRKLKIITTQMIRMASGIGDGSLQSAAFNANTKAIVIRGWTGGNQTYVNFEIGSNPTADYTNFFLMVHPPFSNTVMPETLTFNVNAGEKIACQAAGNSEVRVHIIELGY